MIKRALVAFSLLVSGCAVNHSSVSEQDYLQGLALNEAAASQVRDTGFYIPPEQALVTPYDDSQLQQSIRDWHDSQKPGALYAVLHQENGAWSLKEITSSHPAYAANDTHYQLIGLNSAAINNGASRLVIK